MVPDDRILIAMAGVLLAANGILTLVFPEIAPLSLLYALPVFIGIASRRQLVPLIIAVAGSLVVTILAVAGLPATGAQSAPSHLFSALIVLWAAALMTLYIQSLQARSASAEAPADRGESAAGPAIDAAAENSGNERFHHALFNQTYQFVAILDRDGNIIAANDTLLDFSDVAGDEARGTAFWLLPIFSESGDVRQKLQDAVTTAAEGEFFRDEYRISGVAETETIIDLSLKPIRDGAGGVSEIILEARDVTESRSQQEMLHQAQKSAAIGELTAGVAHDFNNILTAVLGNLEILETGGANDKKAAERIRRATDAAMRGKALVQQLLAFSRRQSLNPNVIDVNARLESMNELYEAMGDDVEIKFDLDDDIPRCNVDPGVLETALLNLVLNARDAMGNSGTIEITTRRAEFDETYEGIINDLPPGEYICIAVADTGHGMDEETASRAFDPFFTTKGAGEGTGLGLSMVYGFVKQSEGDVKIYSEEGKGTTVRLYLPGTDADLTETGDDNGKSGASPGDGDAAQLEGCSILVVDDDPDVLKILVESLEEEGCRIDAAASGQDAIALLDRGKRYDLVLTDMIMPGDIGGPEVASAARARDADIPVVFCSGFPKGNLNGSEAAVEGAFFLQKPFIRDELLRLVRRALASRDPQ